MNVSIFVGSLEYLNSHYLIASLNTWVYQELRSLSYTSDKLIKSFTEDDIDIFESIIDLNDDVSVLNKMTIRYDNTDINVSLKVKLLLERGADVHIDDEILLRNACFYENSDLIELLLQFGANAFTDQLLHDVYRNYQFDIIDLLLRHSIDNENVLYYAVEYGAAADIVKEILRCRDWKTHISKIYSSKYCYNDVFVLSMTSSSLEVVKLLHDYGADIRYSDYEPLRRAVINDCQDIVKCFFLTLDISLEVIDDLLNEMYYSSDDFVKMIKYLERYKRTKQLELS